MHGNIPHTISASGFDGNPAGKRPPTKDKVLVENQVGRGASLAGLDSKGAAASVTKAVLTSSVGAGAFPAGDRPGQMAAVAEQEDGGSLMAAAAAARMEWVERQGNNDGVTDMEVSGIAMYAGGLQVWYLWREWLEGGDGKIGGCCAFLFAYEVLLRLLVS